MEAVGWLRQAATEAAAGAPAVAVQLLRNAQSLLPAGHIDSDMVAAELAAALQRAGQVAEASAVAESVLDRPHREDVDVPIRLTLVSALSLQNRTQELIQRAETALMSPLRLVEQALVLTQASYGQTFSSDCTGGEATARRALELAERSGDTAMRVWGLGALSVPVKAQGRYAEALALARQAVDLTFDPTDEMARLRHPHFFLAMALCDSDLVDEARLTYARAIKESQDLGSAWLLPDMLLLSAELRFLVGEWDDAAAELEAGLHLAQEHGQRVSLAQSLSYQAVMKLARGDQVGAGVAIASVENELSAGAPCYGAQLVAFTASALAVARAEPDRAFDLLLWCWNRDVDREVRYYHRYLAPPLVRLSLALAREDIARQVLDTVEAGAALAPEVGTVQSLALRCRGLIDNDPALMLHAVELARRGPRFLDHGSACEDAAAVLAVAGLPGHAKELLLEAQARYEAVNASGLVARVGAALRHLGVRQGTRGQRRASTGWSSLTPSERIVSELVSEGLTNREIGGRLHISPHTVNTHLRHVFRKLSVSTRAELAGKVARSSTVGTDITHSSDVSVLPKAKTSR
jgi:DNA-binding CsgD family transcriptional regulator/tetratricopeptide (TPR) repeat protein